jgi:HlyD family secretion protein
MNPKTSSHPWRRRVMFAAGLAALAAVLFWAYQPRPLPVETAQVYTGRFEQVVEEDGQLRLRQRYLIAAPTQAELQRPTLRVGDAVRQGDVVAVLQPVSPQMIDARTREVLAQRVGSASALRQAASAQWQRLQTALAQAQLEAERAARLAQENFLSAAARDQAQLQLQSAQQAVNAGQADLAAADFALAEARAALSRAQPAGQTPTAQSGLWRIQSPVEGRVIKLHQDSAGPVSVGQPLLELGNPSALEAVIDVMSSEVGGIALGAPVALTTGAGQPPLTGRVERIEPVAFTKVSALGIEEQRVNVVVQLDAQAAESASPALGDGFWVDARIVLSTEDSALLVPSAALVRDGAGWRVFVVQEGRARARAVVVRDRNADLAWVDQGLEAGDEVVLYPGSMVGDGQPVTMAR